eukprot:2991480-Amphidinium_carterae.1
MPYPPLCSLPCNAKDLKLHARVFDNLRVALVTVWFSWFVFVMALSDYGVQIDNTVAVFASLWDKIRFLLESQVSRKMLGLGTAMPCDARMNTSLKRA